MIINCFICKKELNIRPSHIKKTNYCSYQCMGEHRKILYKGKDGPFYGKRHSQESKKKLSEANKGKPSFWKGKKLPKETREKMSKNHADITGSKNPMWRGGIRKKIIYKATRINGKNVYRHRQIMEIKIGRKLSQVEVVHHIDGNSLNNLPENLMLFKNNSEHIKFHKLSTKSR